MTSFNVVITGQYMRQHFQKLKSDGIDQISYFQRLLANRTSDGARNCTIKAVGSKELATSIFDCYAPTSFVMTDFLFKSLHTNHGCPMTGDHLACPLPDRDFRSHDCLCESIINEDCGIYHLSTRTADFHEEQIATFDRKEFERKMSELYLIANNIRMSPKLFAQHAKRNSLRIVGI